MSVIAPQNTRNSAVYQNIYLRQHQRKYQNRWPVDSPHKGPVTRKTFPLLDNIQHQSATDVAEQKSPILYEYQYRFSTPLQWRHNEHVGVSNHQPRDCLLNRLFRRRSKKTSKLRVTGFCEGNSPVTGEFPAQRASYAENVSIWWRHHAFGKKYHTNRPLLLPLLFEEPRTFESVTISDNQRNHPWVGSVKATFGNFFIDISDHRGTTTQDFVGVMSGSVFGISILLYIVG